MNTAPKAISITTNTNGKNAVKRTEVRHEDKVLKDLDIEITEAEATIVAETAVTAPAPAPAPAPAVTAPVAEVVRRKPGRPAIYSQTPEAKRERQRLATAKSRLNNPERYGPQTIRIRKSDAQDFAMKVLQEQGLAPVAAASPVLNTIQSKINELERQIATLKTDFPKNYGIKVAPLKGQLDLLKGFLG